MKHGRTILRGVEYSRFRYRLWLYQGKRCFRCDRQTSLVAPILEDNAFHVHHRNGRGLGGSKRDDVLSAVEGLCSKCHREHHRQ